MQIALALNSYGKRKKPLRLLYASGRMRTDAQRNYSALRRASGAGNESKGKRFVRFLYKIKFLRRKEYG